MDDLVQDLVSDAISTECFGGLLAQPVRAQATLISSPTALNENLVRPARGSVAKYNTIHVQNINSDTIAFEGAKDPSSREAQSAKSMAKDYLIVQIADTSPQDLHGVYDKEKLPNNDLRKTPADDKSKGIHHLAYGRDRGLLKSAQFQRTDQEFLPEARYASEGGMVLNQLANVYDATFTLVGNAIFSPGMYVYFDPSLLGAGHSWQRAEDSSGNITKQSFANIMGIGGYHLITEIDNSIDDKGFSTTLKARWVTGGTIPS